MSEIFQIDRAAPEFPESLKGIPRAPKRLYAIGDLSLLKKECIAIVGSRRATPYGMEVARQIARQTAEAGLVIVSGLAGGIDAAGHRGALDAPAGQTIAVLATGPDICYPASNRSLYNVIRKCGLILSEYPPGTAPRTYYFPERNRLISGLSRAVVVVEADLKSGSLITVNWALQQNRDVMAVPGNITSSLSRGCNRLIQDGAWPLLSSSGVLEYYNYETEKPPAGKTGQAAADLGTDEKVVWKLVRQNDGKTAAELASLYPGPAGQLAGILTVLELKAYIRLTEGKIYIANI